MACCPPLALPSRVKPRAAAAQHAISAAPVSLAIRAIQPQAFIHQNSRLNTSMYTYHCEDMQKMSFSPPPTCALLIIHNLPTMNNMCPEWQVEKGQSAQSPVVLILVSLHATLVAVGCLWGLSFWVEIHLACEHTRGTVTGHHGYSKSCTFDRAFAESSPATRCTLKVSSPRKPPFHFWAFVTVDIRMAERWQNNRNQELTQARVQTFLFGLRHQSLVLINLLSLSGM